MNPAPAPPADRLTLPPPKEAAATTDAGARDPIAEWADAQPLPTREEVEEQMGQTFSEALREAIAEHEANPDAAVPWEEAKRRIIAAIPALQAAYDDDGNLR